MRHNLPYGADLIVSPRHVRPALVPERLDNEWIWKDEGEGSPLERGLPEDVTPSLVALEISNWDGGGRSRGSWHHSPERHSCREPARGPLDRVHLGEVSRMSDKHTQ